MRTLAVTLPFLLGTAAACAANEAPVGESSAAAAELQSPCAGACEGGGLNGDKLLTPVSRGLELGLREDWSPSTEQISSGYYNGSNGNNRLRSDARAAFERMIAAARSAGADVSCFSAYRDFRTQCEVFNNYRRGQPSCEAANQDVAFAGHSEHQLGTACDLSYGPYVAAGQTYPFVEPGDPADRWLQAHAFEYGLANSYPSANTDENDGYAQERWHYRYIGLAAATELHNRGQIAVPVFIKSLSQEQRDAFEGGGGGGSAGGDCGNVDYGGYCDKNTIVYCKDGVLTRKD